jgi:hypothetical protein
MNLREKLGMLGRALQEKLGVAPPYEPWETARHLEADKHMAERVIELLAKPGQADIERAYRLLRERLLENFVDGTVKRWEDFAVLKGTIKGLDRYNELAQLIVAAGLEAERRMEAGRKPEANTPRRGVATPNA